MATKTAITRTKGQSHLAASSTKLSNKHNATSGTKHPSALPVNASHKSHSTCKPGQKTPSPKQASHKNKKVTPVPALQKSSLSSTESEDSDSSLPGKRREDSQRARRNNRSAAVAHIPQQPKKRATAASETRHRLYNSMDSRDQVYCGPTFSNAPAPSALPMPAFLPQQTSRTPLVNTMQTPFEQSYFVEDNIQLQSKEILCLLSPPQPYNRWPSMLASSQEFDTDRTVSEIQRGLRTMLKIQA